MAFAVLGMEMVGFTITGIVIDWLVGWRFMWATVVLTLLGVAAAFMHLVRAVQPGQPPKSDRPRGGEGP
jgi:F0F1-type ATP synthase assembly protein I